MPEIRHKVNINAEPEKVFAKLTTLDGLAGWWTPATAGNTDVGGRLTFAFGPDYSKDMEVVKLVPDKLVSWRCIHATEEWINTNLEFELEKEGERTVVYFSHSDWRDYTSMFSQCSYDWAMFLRSLRILCETERGLPYPHQHE